MTEFRHAGSFPNDRASLAIPVQPAAPVWRPVDPPAPPPPSPFPENRLLREGDAVSIPAGDELLTVGEVAKAARYSRDTVRRHILKGALPAVRIGPFRRVRVRRRDLAAYLGA